jgi:hypothetical protein
MWCRRPGCQCWPILGFQGIADVEPVAEPPAAYRPSPSLEPLLPIVEPAAVPLAGLTAFDVVDDEIQQLFAQAAQNNQTSAQAVQNDQRKAASGSSEQVEPPIIEQEVVPTKALSIRRSTPKSQLETEQVKPRKSVRPLSRFSDLQERIDAANAKLEAASLHHIARPSPRKPR